MDFNESEWPDAATPRKKRQPMPRAADVIPPRSASPPADAEPFNPSLEPWIGDVWRAKHTGVVVDIVDVQVVGEERMVTFDVRPPISRPQRRRMREFLEQFESRVLVEPRPEAKK